MRGPSVGLESRLVGVRERRAPLAMAVATVTWRWPTHNLLA